MITLLALACAPAPAPRPPAPAAVVPLDREALKAALFAPSDHVKVVNFWATWCGPCKREMPILREWGRAHPEVELVFVDLDLPRLADTVVRPFVDQQDLWGFTHYVLDDPDPMKALPSVVPEWPDRVPVTLVVGPDGAVRRRYEVALEPGVLSVE